MLSRRQIFQCGVAALAFPTFASAALADETLGRAPGAGFGALIRERLRVELEFDNATAKSLAPILENVGFDWSLQAIPAAQIESIVAYSFGNRPNANSGNTSSSGANQAAIPDPGPINELLADAVYAIYTLKPVRIYAQWEIARFLVSKYKLTSDTLYSVEPVYAADGTVTYLSTQGVADNIVAYAGGAAALGKVAVVGHRDHAKRCIETSVGAGVNAFASADVALPLIYDPQSGQPWTRNRPLYLVHDMYAQLYMLSAAAQAKAYPNG